MGEAMKATTREIGEKYVNSAPVEFFTAHEAMQLDLEEALTRPVGDKYYNLSAHLLWIGDRTRQLDNAHVEYFRGISNPIGGKVEDMLPTHIEAVKATGVPVVWQCDAVHGNGIVAKSNGLKTRHMDDIVAEIVQCIKVHRRCGSILGGIHVEATGQETVTECLGGCVGLTED